MAESKNQLPKWNLKDFYQDINDPQIKTDLGRIKSECESFAKKYRGKIATISASEFGTAIKEYEELGELIGKVQCFAFLSHATNVSKPEYQAFLQNVGEKVSQYTTNLLFFTLEINRLEQKQLDMALEEPTVAHYKPWLRDISVFRKYQLSDKEEELLHEKDLTSSSAWVKLFDQTEAKLRFPFNDKQLTIEKILDKYVSPIEEDRKLAAQSIGATFKENSDLIAFIYNTLLKDKEIDDRKRGFEKPISSRNVSNLIEDEVVESLISTVIHNYANLAQRYYKLKAKIMNKDVLNFWDRNAPLSESTTHYSWEDSKTIVLDAYRQFSPQMAEIAQMFFDHNWIDAEPAPGKRSGAFSHSTIPSIHPYVMLNFQNKARDVMTLAHELGHGVHQYLARKQGNLMADTPLTIAETASVFGEQLTFRALLENEQNAQNKKLLIAGKVEDMLNTVVRQVAFCEFEQKAHQARRTEGDLSVERLNEIWIETQKQSFGDSIKLNEDYGYFWYYIPHFFHTPFYVYSYAFGDCLVNSLYHVYQNKSVNDFESKYIEMLSAGGSKRYDEILEPFNLNPKDANFWQNGLDKVSELIDMLETTIATQIIAN